MLHLKVNLLFSVDFSKDIIDYSSLGKSFSRRTSKFGVGTTKVFFFGSLIVIGWKDSIGSGSGSEFFSFKVKYLYSFSYSSSLIKLYFSLAELKLVSASTILCLYPILYSDLFLINL